MQKWKKAALAFILVMAIIGGLIGAAMGKSGVGRMKILGELDVLSIFMLSLLVFMVDCLVLDIFKILQGKKKFRSLKFEVTLKTRKSLRNVLILFILGTIFGFILFFTSIDMHMLPVCFMAFILTLMLAIHYIVGDGISENGILYLGTYHNWSEITSYKVENEVLLEMNLLSRVLGFKYNNRIKFYFDREFKEHIESFLAEKL
jgi:hypothetical protein